MNLKCKLLGHRVTLDERGRPQSNDSGYAICERCGSHESYDRHEWNTLAHGLLRISAWNWYFKLRHPWVFVNWYWGAENARNCHARAPWNQVAYEDIPF